MRTPVEVTAAVLAGRYSALIVWNLFWEGKGFYQLLRDLDGIARRTLALELEDLERNGIVAKRVQRTPQLRVTYALTNLGTSLKVVVGTMYEWGLMARHLPIVVRRAAPEAPGFSHSDHLRAVVPPSEAEGECQPESTVHVPEADGH